MTVAEAKPSIPEGARTASRPWDSPYAKDFGIPWEQRKYVFDWTIGRITVAPCGDGHASNGGWKVTTNVDTTTGKATFVRAEASEEAYAAQNRLGFPMMDYKDAEKVHRKSETERICLRDAMFAVLDLDELGLNESQKLSCAGAREVYSIPRPQVKAANDRLNAAKAKLSELTKRPKK